MLTLIKVYPPSEIPVVGYELMPYVQLRLPDRTVSTEDVPKEAPIAGHFLRYNWYRIQRDREVCSIHPSVKAEKQCNGCSKAKIPVAMSYHCSPECFKDAWKHHRVLHEWGARVVNKNRNEKWGARANLPSSQSNTSLSSGTSRFYPTYRHQKGDTWYRVGHFKTYTPSADDIGHVLSFECVVVNAETKLPLGNTFYILTSFVMPALSPTPRRLISVSDANASGFPSLKFSVLSYNILSEWHASNDLYGYCPSWVLSWSYRRQNLLREIVDYQADIICLQEVQKDHFKYFFKPELDKHGYEAFFRRKSTEGFSGNKKRLDGCATFFRKDKFSYVKKYAADFNKSAHSLIDASLPASQETTAYKTIALKRMIQDNVALLLVLEAKFGTQGSDSLGKSQLICVANTHVDMPRELKDVKLWQVHKLVEALKKLAGIPMLVCGDFNSIPGSALHAFLARGKIDHPMHPDMRIDPLGILYRSSKFRHDLRLVSAYAPFARTRAGSGSDLEKQRKIMDLTKCEPLFTNCTGDFIGTRDYIFYSDDSLIVEGLLELLDDVCLKKYTALPSPVWPSDHIALLAEFRFKPPTPRR